MYKITKLAIFIGLMATIFACQNREKVTPQTTPTTQKSDISAKNRTIYALPAGISYDVKFFNDPFLKYDNRGFIAEGYLAEETSLETVCGRPARFRSGSLVKFTHEFGKYDSKGVYEGKLAGNATLVINRSIGIGPGYPAEFMNNTKVEMATSGDYPGVTQGVLGRSARLGTAPSGRRVTYQAGDNLCFDENGWVSPCHSIVELVPAGMNTTVKFHNNEYLTKNARGKVLEGQMVEDTHVYVVGHVAAKFKAGFIKFVASSKNNTGGAYDGTLAEDTWLRIHKKDVPGDKVLFLGNSKVRLATYHYPGVVQGVLGKDTELLHSNGVRVAYNRGAQVCFDFRGFVRNCFFEIKQ
ncbi:hypothetical protein [uncultured Microscilla sp.]|uniref:hypothetical protein n=1 Tax=uncultured Microscilla sp. TaxID=432653 RepID=UPI0026188FF0|nr:hypothetical protein [uncultured Microscilla sp.]